MMMIFNDLKCFQQHRESINDQVRDENHVEVTKHAHLFHVSVTISNF